jgi:hypothetical protein
MEDIESSTDRYLVALETADQQEWTIAKAKPERLQHRIAALKEQMRVHRDSRRNPMQHPTNNCR